MAQFSNQVFYFPNSGTPSQNLSDIVLMSPKANANQLAGYVLNNNRIAGPTGTLNSWGIRWVIPVVDVRVSGYQKGDY